MKKAAAILLSITLIGLSGTNVSHANFVWGNFAALDSSEDVQDAVWFEGTFGQGVLPAELYEPGTRFFWHPGMAAVRGGKLTVGEAWQPENIGNHSFAFGHDARASGISSAAFGQGQAYGEGSFAAGTSDAAGAHSVAFGDSTSASGDSSFAVGVDTSASGPASFASGDWSAAVGPIAFAHGAEVYATGEASAAFGWWSHASGRISTAHGNHTSAQGYAQFVVGQNNIPQGNADSLGPNDLLFIVGNGEVLDDWSPGTPSNAFTVAENGDAMVARDLSVGGVITVPEAGDLSMGPFTAGSP